MERLRRNWDIALILALFVALGLAYSIVNPLHEATDELRHYRFVRYLVTYQELPVQGEEACRSQSHHPPLYYFLAALATAGIETGRDVCHDPPSNPFWAYRYEEVGRDNKNMYLHGPEEAFPWQGEALAVHVARALNVLIGALTVGLTWATGRGIWPKRRSLAAGGAAIVAFNPMFLYLSGAINNDVIAAASGAAVLYGCVRLLGDPAGLRLRWGVILGVLYGVALMSKFNMAVVALLIAVAVTVVAWRHKQARRWLQVAALAVFVAALVAGWWFVRNQLLYGEPTGFERLTELWGVRDPIASLPLAIFELPHAWSTLWGRFGFGQIPLPQAFYSALAWAMLFAIAGLIIPVVRRRQDTDPAFLSLLIVNVLIAFAVLFNYMLVSPAGAMGRFFFPGLPALALLAFYGLAQWVILARSVVWTAVAGRRRPLPTATEPLTVLAVGVNVAMVLFAVVALVRFVAPAYARPPSFAAGTEIPNEIDARFDAFVTLRGFELSRDSLQPGDTLDVTLYWEVNAQPPGNFLFFVHLIDEQGVMVAQRDTHPGLGSFPTGQWRPGDRFADTVRLHIPDTAYTPSTATVSIGFYAPTYRLAVYGPDGEAWGDSLDLETVSLLPASDLYGGAEQIPNPVRKNFGLQILLLGYEYESRQISPGSDMQISLYWQALQDDLPKMTLELQLRDATGRVRESKRESLPTTLQDANGVVKMGFRLPIGAELAAGDYEPFVLLAERESGERYQVRSNVDGHRIADGVALAPVRVVAPTAE